MVQASPLFASATTVTMTLASLASSTSDVGRESAAIDNTSLDAIDISIGGKVTTGTSPTASKQIEVWLSPSYDGTTYAGGATGSDAGLTPTGSKTLMKLVAVIPTSSTSNVTYQWCCPSVAAAMGGTLPPKFNVYITHNTGANLNSTGGNHEVKYRAINYEST